jgi:hypothetical protein
MIYLIIGIIAILFILFGFGIAVQQYRIQKRMLENGQSILPDYQTLTRKNENK